MSCPIRIKFVPELNEDIFDYLPILSATGPIRIPIECTCKKAIVTALEETIDFNEVIFGEEKQLDLYLTNSGALKTEIIMKSLKGMILQERDETSSYVSSHRMPASRKNSRHSGSLTKRDIQEIDDDYGELKKTLE